MYTATPIALKKKKKSFIHTTKKLRVSSLHKTFPVIRIWEFMLFCAFKHFPHTFCNRIHFYIKENYFKSSIIHPPRQNARVPYYYYIKHIYDISPNRNKCSLKAPLRRHFVTREREDLNLRQICGALYFNPVTHCSVKIKHMNIKTFKKTSSP